MPTSPVTCRSSCCHAGPAGRADPGRVRGLDLRRRHRATLPLIPVFAILVGLHTKATTQRQWRLLSRLGGHFLDVWRGCPRSSCSAAAARSRGDRRGHRLLPAGHHGLAAGRVLVWLRARARRRPGHRAGRGRGRAAPAGRAHELPDRVARAAAHPEAYLPLRAVAPSSTPAPRAPPRPGTSSRSSTPRAGHGAQYRPAGRAGRVVSLRTDAIKLTGVCLAYPGRGRDALAAVNLTIRPGDQITLTGPSGAGKSSLLALLLRFAAPTEGRIEVGGLDLTSVPLEAGAARSAGCRSSRTCSPRRWPRTSRWATRRPARRPSPWRRRRPGRPPSSKTCRRATTPRSASTGSDCPRDSASRSRWPARSCGMPAAPAGRADRASGSGQRPPGGAGHRRADGRPHRDPGNAQPDPGT